MKSCYHYWINKKEKILPVYNLIDKGVEKKTKKCIYKTTNVKSINRGIELTENKAIYKMDIEIELFVKELSEKIRFLYNDNLTILEMDGRNIDIAHDILFSLVNEKEPVFFIDDAEIIEDEKTSKMLACLGQIL